MPERERVEQVLHDLALGGLPSGRALALQLVDDYRDVVQQRRRPHDRLRRVRERAEVGVRALGRVAPDRARRFQGRRLAASRSSPQVHDERLHAEKGHQGRGEARRQHATERQRRLPRRGHARHPLLQRARRLHEGSRLHRLVGRGVKAHLSARVVGHERGERPLRPPQMRHAPRAGPLAAEPALAVGEIPYDVLGVRARDVGTQRAQRGDDARLVQQHVAVERPLAHASRHRHAHERAHVARVHVHQVARDPRRRRRHGVAQLALGVRDPEPPAPVHVPALD